MSKSLVGVDPNELDPFRAGTLLCCLAMAASYLLPWATVDGIGQRIGEGGVVNVSTTVQGSISAGQLGFFPELVVAVAVGAALVAALRWTAFWQFAVGVLGLGSGFAALIAWAVIDADGRSELVEIGPFAATPAAFDPAAGLWVAIFGSLGLIACGFAAATRTYVRIKELAE
ncbi:hypothetical protein GRX03_04700 [Halovenus sp. WSH3]|uniref:Uncharacterized protein n=1 Tax=Halovenus carboxidivorans TaxID=2692199 RepID=A0A6B0T150_9EURY|nr:hypothetical protein [Halovenus carboxidivorans]MXR50907.1 hypothetical protein [Halovenus carboxidivorans]